MNESGVERLDLLYLVRLAQSYANLKHLSHGSSWAAGLTENGIRQATTLVLPFDTDQPVRVSELRRVQLTAHYAGYNNIIVDPRLNETMTRGASSFRRLASLLKKGWLPEDTLMQAEDFFMQLPPERLLFASSLTIASFCRVAGRPLERTPRHFEVVTIDLSKL